MKGMVYTKVGGLDVLKIKDIPKPIPKDNQVLVQVRASTLNIVDHERFKTLSDKVPLFPRFVNIVQGGAGKPLGGEVAGIVVEFGNNVTSVNIGDEVYGKTLGMFPCGGWAEFALLDMAQVCQKPSTLSFEESAVIPISAETALGAVRSAKIKQGQQVMIYGASGGVGGYAVQFAKAMGAIVTGVCSTRNIDVARSIGCDFVIDYKRKDFTKIGTTYDAIIGINGCNPMASYKRLLNESGIFVGVGDGRQAVQALCSSVFSKRITFYAAPIMPVKDYLPFIKEIAEAGKLKPFIDKIYPMSDVTEAIRYVVTEHAQGKIALSMDL